MIDGVIERACGGRESSSVLAVLLPSETLRRARDRVRWAEARRLARLISAKD